MFDGCDLVASFDCFANNFVAYAERQIGLPPTASDSVDIRAADAASLNEYVYIVLLEWLGFVLENSMRRFRKPWERMHLLLAF